MQFSLADYNQRQDYLDALDRVQYRAGTTNTADALNMIRTQGKFRRNGKPIIQNGNGHTNSYSKIYVQRNTQCKF